MERSKPNIIFIYPDQHRGSALGCSGNSAIITPNLDRLAEGGVNFTRCSTNSPLCMPARASMMTGQHVGEHGVWNNSVHADPEESPSHVRNIRNAGYYTAMIGKDHLIHFPKDLKKGFRSYYMGELEKWGFDFKKPTHTHQSLGNAYPRPPKEGAELSYPQILEKNGFLENTRNYMKDYYTKVNTGTAVPWEEEPSPVPFEYHLDHYIGDQAVEWIQNYEGEKPFYLQILFTGPHDPFDSCQEYRDKYTLEDMPVGIMTPPEDPMAPNVEGVMKWSNLKGMTEKQKKIMTLYYYASITQIDEMVGKIVEIIKRKGISDNTWIIYHADHGEMLGDHMMSHKLVFYESALRVPCIIKPPDNHDGRLGWNSSALADTLDVVATMIDIAGAESLKDSESRSLLSKISNGDEDPEAHVGKDYVISEVIGFAMIRNEKCKLSVNLNKGNPKKFWGVSTDTDSFMDPVEMYDVEKDPDELHNVVRDPQYEEVRNKLLGKLDDHIQKKLGHEKLQRFVTATSTGSALARG
jgi:choline-sulfatase